ncbi:hypothetical protein FWF48_03940 [Candidatus Saccharibacteria bacterium]|nr:hypothetical protein [Candidatus Saccharibacteria bacterium]
MNYDEDSEFSKEFKRFAKKWRSLPNDIKDAKLLIEKMYTPQDKVNIKEYKKSLFNSKRATILHNSDTCEVVKMRLDCAALGNKELLRLIFVFVCTENGVTFIELYAKNDKSREDEKRIRKYIV